MKITYSLASLQVLPRPPSLMLPQQDQIIDEDALVSENIIMKDLHLHAQFHSSLKMSRPSWFHQSTASHASNSCARTILICEV